MDTKQARSLAQTRLEGVTDPYQKLQIVNEVIQELGMTHNYLVLSPLAPRPLRQVRAVMTQPSILSYETF